MVYFRGDKFGRVERFREGKEKSIYKGGRDRDFVIGKGDLLFWCCLRGKLRGVV